MKNESKNEMFKRVAEKRVNACLEALRKLRSMSDRSYYEYSNEEIESIIKAINKEINLLESSFKNNKAFKI